VKSVPNQLADGRQGKQTIDAEAKSNTALCL